MCRTRDLSNPTCTTGQKVASMERCFQSSRFFLLHCCYSGLKATSLGVGSAFCISSSWREFFSARVPHVTWVIQHAPLHCTAAPPLREKSGNKHLRFAVEYRVQRPSGFCGNVWNLHPMWHGQNLLFSLFMANLGNNFWRPAKNALISHFGGFSDCVLNPKPFEKCFISQTGSGNILWSAWAL